MELMRSETHEKSLCQVPLPFLGNVLLQTAHVIHLGMIGNTYNRLTVIALVEGSRPRKLVCRCECGTEKTFRRDHVVSGLSKSCGCLHSERSRARALAGVPHKNFDDRSKTPEYGAWLGMRQRCFNKKQHKYANYGGRGITVCERWMDFDNFLADMGPRPSSKHSLDRIDNNGNYEPSNCRWASRTEQQNNRNVCCSLYFQGRWQTIAEWSRELGIGHSTIWERLRTQRLSMAQVLSTESMRGKRR